MPNKKRGVKLEQDDVVRELVRDPSEVPGVRVFVGLLGAGAQDGYWRLYFSVELKDYLEVREKDVLLSRSMQTPENPLGGTALWVRSDAELSVTRRASPEREAEFLTGRITASFLQGAVASGFSLGGVNAAGRGIKSIPPVESCVPALCLPPPPPPDPPDTTAVCTLSTRCRTEFLCL